MLAQERPGQTLQPTALVHEAYLRLVGDSDDARWNNRRHFFMATAEAMRRVLVDNAHRKLSSKQGGGWRRSDLDALDADALPDPGAGAEAEAEARSESELDLAALDVALNRLAEVDPQKAKLVAGGRGTQPHENGAGLSYARGRPCCGLRPARCGGSVFRVTPLGRDRDLRNGGLPHEPDRLAFSVSGIAGRGVVINGLGVLSRAQTSRSPHRSWL